MPQQQTPLRDRIRLMQDARDAANQYTPTPKELRHWFFLRWLVQTTDLVHQEV